MKDDDLLSVGQFARLAGLRSHALRHYDAVQLLPPVEVHPQTGYRRYARFQLATARLISDLRWLSVPIQQVREIIVDPDAPPARQLLAEQAERLIREQRHLDQQIAQLTNYAHEGIRMPTLPTAIVPVQIKIGVSDRVRARTFYERRFTVTDLDEAHRRALRAGGTEAVALNTPRGMPRNSAVTDPDGNWIWLYQG
ncbi:MAG: MerR family transcriptional regulator [Chloroflexi bacterium]|nr:MerR family transcriptional regulator [Chloroflexota bacterium]